MSEENPPDHRSTRRTVLASSLAAAGFAGCLSSTGEESTPTRTPMTEASTPTGTATPYATPTPPEKPPLKEAPEGLPGGDIEIQHLDREPPTVEKPYGSPDVRPAEPETQAEIQEFKEKTIEAQHERLGNPEQYEPVEISSLEELSAYARASNVYVKMEPGTYEITRENIHKLVQANHREEGDDLALLIWFQGSNAYYDLRDVEITFSARIFPDTGKPVSIGRAGMISVEGRNQIIRGLTFRIVDPDPRNVNYPAVGAGACSLKGQQNMLRDVTVETDGSWPYGYGDFLGKGPGSFLEGITKIKKVGCFTMFGVGNVAVGVDAIGKSLGHVLTWEGEDMVFVDCTATGETRLTDEILQETSGPAYRTGFKYTWSIDEDGRIEPGMMISLTEQGFRTYQSELTGTVVNCTVDSTRSGPSVEHANADVFISNLETHRTPRGAYHPAPEGTYVDNSADIRYGPAIRILKESGVEINVEILPSPTDDSVTQHYMGRWMDEYLDVNPKMAAWINGGKHDITFTASEDLQLREDDPHYIVIGLPSDNWGWDYPGTPRDITLRNETGLPVLLTDVSSNCTIVTDGEVDDRGENNTIQRL